MTSGLLAGGLLAPRGSSRQAVAGVLAGTVAGSAACLALATVGPVGIALAVGLGVGAVAGLVCLSSRAATAFVLAGTGFTYTVEAVQPSGVPALVPVLALVALIVCSPRWSTAQDQRRFVNALVLLGAYAVVLLASSLVATDPVATFASVADLVRSGLVVMALMVLVRDREVLRAAVWGIVLIGGAVAAISAYQYLTGSFGSTFFGFARAARMNIVSDIDDFRIAGTLDDPNFFAQMMAVVVPLGIERVRNERHVVARSLAGLCAGLASLAVVFTASRGGLIGLAVGVLLSLRLVGLRWRSLVALAVAAGVGGILLLPHSAQRAAELVEVTEVRQSESVDPALRGRASEMLTAVHMFVDRPLLGVGAGNYPQLYADYALHLRMDARRVRSAHSLPLNVAAETGIVGVVSLAAVLGLAFSRLGRAHRVLAAAGDRVGAELVAALRIATITFLICSVVLHQAYPRMLWILVALAWATTTVAADPGRSGSPGSP